MHRAIIIGIVRSLIVDVAMGQIPRSTERISSFYIFFIILVYIILYYIVLFFTFIIVISISDSVSMLAIVVLS